MKRLLIACLLLSGCATTTDQTLYSQLGGQEGLEKIAGNFIYQIGENDDIRPYFMNSNLDRFYNQIIAHLCEITDGPCTYEGDDMLRTHQGMDITEGHFNTVVDLMIAAMDDAGIPHTVQNKLLARLAPLREDIIYH